MDRSDALTIVEAAMHGWPNRGGILSEIGVHLWAEELQSIDGATLEDGKRAISTLLSTQHQAPACSDLVQAVIQARADRLMAVQADQERSRHLADIRARLEQARADGDDRNVVLWEQALSLAEATPGPL